VVSEIEIDFMVDEQRLRRWITAVRRGRRPTNALIDELRRLPFDDLGFARLDTHRRLRRGAPEIVLCEGKTAQQLRRIIQQFATSRETLLLTRLDASHYQTLRRDLPALRYHPDARIAYWLPRRQTPKGFALVVTGGTSDAPIAEEAALTLEVLGSRTHRLYDVGVAGVHRLLSQWRLLQRARVIVVIAGMEGALASVVAGLVRCPVIAVPTSIGYGASFQGIGPLLTMLNSCVPGVGVVNIDNGFGAGYLAHLINMRPHR
jgi:NCAIR mutase (PurE)-related protein